MDFETTEDGFLAKILFPAGTNDIAINAVCFYYYLLLIIISVDYLINLFPFFSFFFLFLSWSLLPSL